MEATSRLRFSLNFRSRSGTRYFGISSRPTASRICHAVHSAVGDSATLVCRTSLRLWLSTTKINRTQKVAGDTVKKSVAIMSLPWFSKKVRHDCDGGFLLRIRYLDTVVCETRIGTDSALKSRLTGIKGFKKQIFLADGEYH